MGEATPEDSFFNVNRKVVNGGETINVSDFTLLISLNEKSISEDLDAACNAETLAQGILQSKNISSTSLTREQFRTCLESYCSGTAGRSRPRERVLKNTKDIADIQSMFILWAGRRDGALVHGDLSIVLSLFNKSSDQLHNSPDRKHKAGRMLFNYYDRANFGYDINLHSFTRWVFEEAHLLELDFQVETQVLLKRLRQLVQLVSLYGIWDWQKTETLEVEEFNKVMALFNGEDWETVDISKRPEQGLPYYTEKEPLGVKEFSIFIREAIDNIEGAEFDWSLSRLEAIVMSRGLLWQVTSAFRKYDINGEGIISKKELSNVMSRIYDFKTEELDLLMEGADTKKDGNINYTEFARWVLEAANAEAMVVS